MVFESMPNIVCAHCRKLGKYGQDIEKKPEGKKGKKHSMIFLIFCGFLFNVINLRKMPNALLYQYTILFGLILIVSMFFSFIKKLWKIPFVQISDYFSRMFPGKKLIVKGNELFRSSWYLLPNCFPEGLYWLPPV